MLYATTLGNIDAALGQRAAVAGKGLEDTIRRLMGEGPGNPSFLDIVGGAAFGISHDYGSDIVNGIRDIYYTAISETSGVTDILPGMVADILDNVSTFSRGQRAFWALKHGEWISQETGRVLTSVTPAESIIALLGIEPRDLAEVDWMRSVMQNDENFRDNLAKRGRKLLREAYRAKGEGDMETWAQKHRVLRALLQPFDSRTRFSVQKSASRLENQDLYTMMLSNVYRNMGSVGGATKDAPAPNTRR